MAWDILKGLISRRDIKSWMDRYLARKERLGEIDVLPSVRIGTLE